MANRVSLPIARQLVNIRHHKKGGRWPYRWKDYKRLSAEGIWRARWLGTKVSPRQWKAMRAGTGMTLAEVAKLAGVSNNSISRLERGYLLHDGVCEQMLKAYAKAGVTLRNGGIFVEA